VGVHQGSVLGPLLFAINTSSIAAFAQLHGMMQQQQYADDSQLYIVLTPLDPSSELAAVKSCLASLQLWFYTRAQSFSGLHSIDVAGSATPLNSHIKLL